MAEPGATLYTAKMRHSAATIEKLIIMQYDTFQVKNKLIRGAVALAALVYGILTVEKKYITSYLCLILGGAMLAGMKNRPRHNARLVIEQMKGKFPASDYFFTKSGFRDSENSKEIPYGKLIRIIDDKTYLYLYVSAQSAYMVKASSAAGENGLIGLKDLISAKSGLKWSHPASFWNFNISTVREILSEQKKDSYVGERLGDRRRFFK